jgi:hypothetical protein
MRPCAPPTAQARGWALGVEVRNEGARIDIRRDFVSEVHVPTLQCPECDFKFSEDGVGAGWTEVVVSSLLAAPAVPDMATQARCPKCHHLLTEGDVRYFRSTLIGYVCAWLVVMGIVLIAWFAA